MPNRPTRHLAAIVAADVAEFSHLIGLDEEGTLSALRGIRRKLIEPLLVEHGGRVANTAGDSLLLEFPSVVEAVRCAVAMQEGVALSQNAVPGEKRLQFRVGIHLGDVMEDDGDLLGDGVNIAARLEAIADPGGITISDDAYRQIRGRLELYWDDEGERSLKNIADPVRVWRWSGDLGQAAGTRRLDLPDKPSIAILPFENMSGDADQEFLADGIAEDIITELSRFRSLFVIARNSSFTYKGRATDVQRVARELGVRYILEGSVRKSKNRVRVTAQLIDAVTRSHVWAERYDREIDDIFDLQDEISQTTVAAIEPELGNAERDRAHRAPPENLDAWGLYQRGLWHAYRFTAEDNTEARSLFKRATEADPAFAPAFAGLSFAYFTNAFLGFDGDRDHYRALALESAKKSLTLDERDPSAHWALGRAYMIRGELEPAIAALEKAIELNPNYAQAYYVLGWTLVMAGRHEEALGHLDQSERLSPNDPLIFAICAARMQAMYLLGDMEGALVQARRTARYPNSHANTRALLVAVLGRLGKLDEAKVEFEKFLAEYPGYTCRDFAAAFPYRDATNLERLLKGLEAAGMPR